MTMTLDDWGRLRVLRVAQMAATLAAGDGQARYAENVGLDGPLMQKYAGQAAALFAVVAAEGPDVDLDEYDRPAR